MNWYVIQTKPKKEEEASSYLSNMGVEILAPLIEDYGEERKDKQRGETSFPGYVFGNFDIEQNYPLVRWARGVKKVLGYEGNPTQFLKEWSISLKQERTAKDLKMIKHFEPDDVVRVTSGPLKIFWNLWKMGLRQRTGESAFEFDRISAQRRAALFNGRKSSRLQMLNC